MKNFNNFEKKTLVNAIIFFFFLRLPHSVAFFFHFRFPIFAKFKATFSFRLLPSTNLRISSDFRLPSTGVREIQVPHICYSDALRKTLLKCYQLWLQSYNLSRSRKSFQLSHVGIIEPLSTSVSVSNENSKTITDNPRNCPSDW